MEFQIDHDYHIHSQLSRCSNDPQQSTANILAYAREKGLTDICLTDHFWDADIPLCTEMSFYAAQNYAHVAAALPLPQTEGVRFHFGCETDLDKHMTLGMTRTQMDAFSFIIIPTTHLHMMGFTLDEADSSPDRRAKLYIQRLDAVLDMDLPFHKIGIAHLTCPLMAPGENAHLDVLDRISDQEFSRVFTRLAEKGAGFELNENLTRYSPENLTRILRPYRIAKAVGCKFYLGSDAHHPEHFDTAHRSFRQFVDLLELQEEDKFRVCF